MAHVRIHHLIEQHAMHMPDAIAIIHHDQSYTYAALNSRADALAQVIKSIGSQSPFIAILLPANRDAGSIRIEHSFIRFDGQFIARSRQ